MALSKEISEYMSDDHDTAITESSKMTQISTNSTEAAGKLSATVAGKSKKRIREVKSFESERDVKRQRQGIIEKKRKKQQNDSKESQIDRPRKRRAQSQECRIRESNSVISEVTNEDNCSIVITTENCRNGEKVEEKVSLPPHPSVVQVPKPAISEKFLKEDDFLMALKKLLATSAKIEKPSFKFEVSDDAAEFNMNKLKDHNFDLDHLLNEKSSVTRYGSEFKSTSELEPLLGCHPRWREMKDRLENGSFFPISEVTEEVRLQDIEATKKRGNHKSAEKHESYLAEAFTKEVKKGWILLLPDKEVENIPDLELAPMGVADQLGVSANGEFVNKLRVTHDLSFPGKISGESINSRVQKDLLEPCMFGHTLLRVIHTIVHLRQKYPSKRIWLRKEDFKSAYRRLHLKAKTALKSAVRVKLKGKYYLLLSLRLPFGGSPCPPEFCLISDIITDTINDLLNCTSWDPKEICSEYAKKVPAPRPQPSDVPFAPAHPTSVKLPEKYNGKADCFVDDIISIAVDIEDNLQKLIAAPCTVIHAVANRAEGTTFVERNNMISDEKNEAEGAPEEVKICLGWKLNSRTLQVSLPSHKYQAWDSQITTIITSKTASNETLESILGRLENVALIIAMFGHFLNNIRSLQIKASRSNHNVHVSKNAIAELQLARSFLKRAHQGVSMNCIVFRKPTHVYLGDASEHGLGGFSVKTGKAWRYLIPVKLRGRAHINLLEFLVQVVSIWIDMLDGAIYSQDCLLAMGDNTTAAGWCKRTNFRENNEADTDWMVKQKVARKLASLVLDKEAVLYTQWFKGISNVVTDSLSRDLYFLSPSSHETFLRKTASIQLPNNFKIHQVPNKVSCFITSILQQLPVKTQRLKQQKASELAHSKFGNLSSTVLASQNPYIWKDLTCSSKILSCLPSLTPCESVPTLQDVVNTWWREQSTPPCHMWHRPSGQTTGMTQDWTQTVRHASYSTSSGEHTKTKTVPERNKKLFQ